MSTNLKKSSGTPLVSAAEYNAAFDPANDAFGFAFRDGFKEGWIFAKLAGDKNPDYRDASEAFDRAVDMAPQESYLTFRNLYFSMLPLAAVPEIGKEIAEKPEKQVNGAVAPLVQVKPLQLSDGRKDYFVSIQVGDREITPYVFQEEYKAAYEAASFDWLLNGAEEPSIADYGPEGFPEYERSKPRVVASDAENASPDRGENDLLHAVKALLDNDGGPGSKQFDAQEFAKARQACQQAIAVAEASR